MTSKRLYQRELLFFLITGTVEGMLTALTLVTGKMLRPGEGITATWRCASDWLRVFLRSSFSLPLNTRARDRNYCAWRTNSISPGAIG